MLFIEYDVGDDGMIEVVGLINAIEEHDEDPLGAGLDALAPVLR